MKQDQITCKHCGGKGWLPTPESLRKMRLKTKITLTAMAKSMGMSKSQLSGLELGRWEWNAKLLDSYRASLAALRAK